MENKVLISKSLGSVTVLATIPKNPKTLIVLAHGAGAGMRHPFMESLAGELINRNIGVIRFNFLYMEKGIRRPDPSAIAEKTVAMVVHYAHEHYPSLSLYTAGKSFGGRMTSQWIAKESPACVKGIIFYGFPLHPVGNPSVERAHHLKNIQIPMLFLQGTKDKLADISLLEETCSSLPLATLQKFEGADHSFKIGKQNLVLDLADSTVTWLK